MHSKKTNLMVISVHLLVFIVICFLNRVVDFHRTNVKAMSLEDIQRHTFLACHKNYQIARRVNILNGKRSNIFCMLVLFFKTARQFKGTVKGCRCMHA
jgi:hypothetical protein